MGFDIKAELPSPGGFMDLRRETNWGAISVTQAQASLLASLCGISIYETQNAESKLIGMARVIGDGMLNLYIQDVIITKSHRGQGFGTKLMSALIHSLQQNFPADCTIGLMAAKDQTPFYARFGFLVRPS